MEGEEGAVRDACAKAEDFPPALKSSATILELKLLGAGEKNLLFPDVALGLGGNRSVPIPSRISDVTAGIFSTSLRPGTGVVSTERSLSRSGETLGVNGDRTDSMTATLA